MNRICPTILAAVALSGCGGPNYTLSGRAGLAPGDTLRLCSPYENDSVLATTVIRRDSSFRIRGHVSEPTIANLMHNDRRIGAPILLEAADIRLEPTGDVRGFQFTGTPLNDAFNAMNAAQVSLGNVLQALYDATGLSESKPTSDDGLFTIEIVSCLGACGLSPVVMVNDTVHPAMTPDKAVDLIEELRAKEGA